MSRTKEIKEYKKLNREATIDLLNKNKDSLFRDIASNKSYRQLAEHYNIHLPYLHYYLNLEENQQAKQIALQIASYHQIDEAKQYLESIEADDTNASVRKKSELSQFSTYLAKVKNRKEFDLNYKEQSDNNNQQIVVIPANFTKQIDK
jgi:predicted transcriptional regulator